ncbi:MAG: hypothetical protein IOMNBAOH_02001 [Rhodocyclaceae bacterium]|nr:hypothetical protein [Rhodocyclaceae bacterium]
MIERRASDAATRRLKKALSMVSSGSKVHTRARICELGLSAARANGRPLLAHTSTVSPARARPSIRSTAPAKIQGWRLSSARSRPG